MTTLITAGPTREAIDPVRYLTNNSSGQMGYALTRAAAAIGHRVILISGPCSLEVPPGIDYVPVETAADMQRALEVWLSLSDFAIFSAAVCDYRPASVSTRKIKKSSETMTLELVKNPDLLFEVRSKNGYKGKLVGFAAETENLEENARKKLLKKSCDLVIANDVSRADIGFNAKENEVLLVYPEYSQIIPKQPKEELAVLLMEKICAL